MNYQGINGQDRVVIAKATQEEMNAMKANPAYKFVRFVPIVEKVKVAPPTEVEDAETNILINTDGDSNTEGRRGRKTNREKS